MPVFNRRFCWGWDDYCRRPGSGRARGTRRAGGQTRLEVVINTYPLIMGGLDLRGNVGGTANDIASVLDWMAKGEIRPTIEKIS
jgi:D-arabinose 1-dehydrogenase-like Zn-dependent alcohol dehydrogenase